LPGAASSTTCPSYRPTSAIGRWLAVRERFRRWCCYPAPTAASDSHRDNAPDSHPCGSTLLMAGLGISPNPRPRSNVLIACKSSPRSCSRPVQLWFAWNCHGRRCFVGVVRVFSSRWALAVWPAGFRSGRSRRSRPGPRCEAGERECLCDVRGAGVASLARPARIRS